jgi:prepilin peptidase CpaA
MPNIDALILHSFLTILGLAAVYDAATLRIPNWISALLASLFVVAAIRAGQVDWLSHLGAAALVFVGGIVLFRFRIFGGGDIKLLTAGALWTGFWFLPFFLLAVGLLGGVVAVFFYVLRKILFQALITFGGNRTVRLPSVLLEGEGVPYGLAIVAGLFATSVQTPFMFGEINVVFMRYFAGLI